MNHLHEIHVTNAEQKKPKKHAVWATFLLLILIFAIAAGAYTYTRPILPIYPSYVRLKTKSNAPLLAWTDGAESSIGAVGYGLLANHGPQVKKPTASTAKLITALMVLQKYPLEVGQTGPSITLTSADVAIYVKYLDEQGSTAAVKAGETITEYQALEAMMLPSANNIADSLAIWAFGSLTNYSNAANVYVKTLGMTNTTVGTDASGFLPSTVSTSSDLLKLGFKAIQSPVLAQIMAEKSAKIPVAGTIHNINWLLGEDGIFGIKTGSNNQDGGVYIFASKTTVANNQIVTLVGVIQGTKTLYQAMNGVVPLINSAKAYFKPVVAVKDGQVIAIYSVPWAGKVDAVAAKKLTVLGWNGLYPKITASFDNLNPTVAAGTTVGAASESGNPDNSVKVFLQNSISSPSWRYKLVRH